MSNTNAAQSQVCLCLCVQCNDDAVSVRVHFRALTYSSQDHLDVELARLRPYNARVFSHRSWLIQAVTIESDFGIFFITSTEERTSVLRGGVFLHPFNGTLGSQIFGYFPGAAPETSGSHLLIRMRV